MKDEFRLDAGPDDDPTARLLSQVLHRQADAVQPSPDGLRRIRAEIARQAPHPATRLVRRWTPLVAAAAVLVLLGGVGALALRWRGQHVDTVTAASGAVVATMDQAEARTAPAATVPVYVVGHQGGRTVLFREFRYTKHSDEESMVADAVQLAVAAEPLDTDYTTLFAASHGTTVTAHVTPAQIKVDISPEPRPVPGVTKADAELAAQQIVWTATAAASVAESGVTTPSRTPSATYKQPGQRPVSITLNGRRGAALFGLAQLDWGSSQGLVRHAHLKGYRDPRADVWIGDLTEGQRLSRGHQKITGDAVPRADGVVHLQLFRNGQPYVLTEAGLGSSEESQFKAPPGPGERGHWSIDLDLTQPGSYVLVVWTGLGPGPTQVPPDADAPSAQSVDDGDQPIASSVDEIDSKRFVVR
jgi:hypothetical protein